MFFLFSIVLRVRNKGDDDEKGLYIVRQHDLTIFAGIPSMPVAFLELHFEIRASICSCVTGLKSK